jgi:holin-like protein
MKEAEAQRPAVWLNTLCGFAIILGCLLTGLWLKKFFHLLIPGNVLGLLVLLNLLALGVVKVAWVERASKLLIFWLPPMFIPVYVNAAREHAMWQEWGLVFVMVLPIGIILMWGLVGRFAQALLAPKSA